MNVSTLEAPAPDRGQRTVPRRVLANGGPAAAPARTAPLRPVRRAGRGTGPEARPARRLDMPVITRGGAAARACRAPAVEPVLPTTTWRLTDRAIALVLVTGLLLVTAAIAVVGLTAVRVTGARYQVSGWSPAAVSAPPALP